MMFWVFTVIIKLLVWLEWLKCSRVMSPWWMPPPGHTSSGPGPTVIIQIVMREENIWGICRPRLHILICDWHMPLVLWNLCQALGFAYYPHEGFGSIHPDSFYTFSGCVSVIKSLSMGMSIRKQLREHQESVFVFPPRKQLKNLD